MLYSRIVYRELPSLSADLGISAKTLYAVSNNLSAHYHTAHIPRRDGGTRCLTVPDEQLKRIQRAISTRLLALQPVSPHAMAYRPGRGITFGARVHCGKKYVLKLDIQSFFDSVRYSSVKDAAFPPEIFAEPLRVLLSMLCYYRDSLPQGAPSSPAIANLLLRGLDDTLSTWCRPRGIAYTRYCDDLTFSASEPPEGVQTVAEQALRPLGLWFNPQKTVLLRDGQRQTVTGLTVNGAQPSVSRAYRRTVRQTLYYCRKYGTKMHLAHIGSSIPAETFLRQLQGQVAFLLQVDPLDAEAASYSRWLGDQLRAF